MKIVVEKEVSLGELLCELCAKRGIRGKIHTTGQQNQLEIADAPPEAWETVAQEFHDAIAAHRRREANRER